jgi:hypothetical protein
MTRTKWLLITILLLISQALYAGNQLKIFDLQHRFASDLLPTIVSLVGSDGTVSAMGNHLIVRASDSQLAQIEQVIASLDVAQKNLKISVRHQRDSSEANSDISASGRVGSGNVEIGVDGGPTRRRRITGNGVDVRLSGQENSIRQTGGEFINVLEGNRAFITVGQSVPYTQQWVTYGQRYFNIQQSTQFRDITTGFEVLPRRIGDQVELEITPQIAQLRNNGMIDRTSLTTTVRGRLGEWIDLGGTMQSHDEVSRAILSSGNSRGEDNQGLWIRVEE